MWGKLWASIGNHRYACSIKLFVFAQVPVNDGCSASMSVNPAAEVM